MSKPAHVTSKRQSKALLMGMRSILRDKRASAKEKLQAAHVIMLVEHAIDVDPMDTDAKSFNGKGLATMIETSLANEFHSSPFKREINNLATKAQ